MVHLSAQDLAALLGGELLGDATRSFSRLAPLAHAGEEAIAFLANLRYQSQLATTNAGCVIVAPALSAAAQARPGNVCTLVCADPYLAFAKLTQWWAARTRAEPVPGVHASAVVAASARLDASACVQALAVVGQRVVIGAGVVIGPHCVIEDDACIGAGTQLAAHVVVGAGCSVGERCILHAGVVIGADGFGFAPEAGRWVKIEQLGAVRIGNDVEIGANTCIDRGALDDTVLEDGVKLDNLVQIGHNVHIGAHSALAGCVGVAGSARIGRHCTAGGGAIVLGHLELADHVHISAATVVTRSIHKPGQYSGVFPFDDNAAWEKNAATLRHLHSLRERLRALETKTGDKNE